MNRGQSSPGIIGHRGARGLFPENTLGGIRRTLALGVDGIELDLGVTRDGVVIVHHDRRLNPDLLRGPDGRWLPRRTPLVYALDAEALTEYDAGRIRPGTRAAAASPSQAPMDGEKVPTLTQVFELDSALGQPAVRYVLEAKLTPLAPRDTPSPEAFADAAVAVVKRACMDERVVLESFDWRFVRAVHRLAPEMALSCLTARRPWLNNVGRRLPGASPWTAGIDLRRFGGSVPDGVAAIGARHWSPYFRDLSHEALERAHDLGLEVLVWTVNELADMHRMIAMGVDAIITDYPDRLRSTLSSLGRCLPTPVVNR